MSQEPQAQPEGTYIRQPSWMAPVKPVVPDHELIRRVGGGSYGDVFLARNVVGTWRAVKVVFRDRFTDVRPYEREFNGMLTFEPLSRSNEAFIDILQIGRNDAEGYFYYVMELADDANTEAGERGAQSQGVGSSGNTHSALRDPLSYIPRTLSKVLLQGGRLPVSECLELGLTLNLGLAHLHNAGLIHRDIKPSNIIFVGGVPKLADIGLVIETSEARSYVGTEGFIPPEGPNSPQADLFSLGKVLYEASMGKDRKDFPEPMTHIADAPDSPQLLEFNAILLKACAANPEQRYQSAEEMNADLALLQSGGSVRLQRKLARQLRAVRRAGVLVTALASLIALGWWWQARQTRLVLQLAGEKSALAANLARLDEENRQRIVRLDIANGVRLLDEGDPGGALLWFAEALPLVASKPAEESIHRIRIQQTLYQVPRPTQVLWNEKIVTSMAFSPDGRRVATGTEGGWVHLWDAQTGTPLTKPVHAEGDEIRQLGFTADGHLLFARSRTKGGINSFGQSKRATAWVIDAASGQTTFFAVATNLVRAEFIAQGRWLVTAGLDHVIRVVDTRDGSQVAALKGHTKNVLAFSSSLDGGLLASTGEDKTIRLWRLPTGEAVGDPLPFHPPQHFPVLSPDGQRLATREDIGPWDSTNGVIRIWNTETLTPIGKPIEASGNSGNIWFAPAPSRRLFVMFGGQLRSFDRDTQVEVLPAIGFERQQVFWTQDQGSQRFMSGGWDGISGLWNLQSGERIAPPFRHGRKLQGSELSPDGTALATLTAEGACVLWKLNLRHEEASHQFEANFQRLGDGAPQRLLKYFSPDRRRFLIPLADGIVRMVDLKRLVEAKLPESKPVHCTPDQCAFSPDSLHWAIAYAPTHEGVASVVELWSDEEGKLRRQFLPHAKESRNDGFAARSAIAEMWHGQGGLSYKWRSRPRGVQNMRFASGGARLMTVSDDRQVRSWRANDGALESSVTLPDAIDEVGDVFPDGRTLFVFGHTVGFGLFSLATGGITPMPMGAGSVTAIALDAAGERFATATDREWGRVWSAVTGEPQSPPIRNDGTLTWLDWSPDGKRLAGAGATPEVRVWDPSSGDLSLPPLRIAEEPLGATSWSLDGLFIVARSGENVVRVWDANTGEAVTPLLKHGGEVRLAHLTADNRLITLSLPNLLRAWDLTETKLPGGVISDYAKLIAGRRINVAGSLQPLKPDELMSIARSLHARAPYLFE